jgi:hypothetical protein
MSKGKKFFPYSICDDKKIKRKRFISLARSVSGMVVLVVAKKDGKKEVFREKNIRSFPQ